MFLDLETIIKNTNGTIFGGYVRDKIIHDKYAQDFYRANLEAHHTLQYDNSDHDPSSWPWRTHIPQDIDVVFSNINFQKFMVLLDQSGYLVKIIYTRPANKYLMINDNIGDILHTKIAVILKVHRLIYSYTTVASQLPSVLIDVLHKDDISSDNIPYGRVDFECNSLIITPAGTIDYMIPKCDPFLKYQKLSRIIENIVQRIAIPVNPEHFRIMKILKRGFTIQDRFVTIKSNIDSREYEGHCVICCDEFKGTDYNIVKNSCCDASYHIACYKKSCRVATTSYNNIVDCVMCRRRNAYATCTSTPFENYFRDGVDAANFKDSQMTEDSIDSF
jgi:hypothetical protein